MRDHTADGDFPFKDETFPLTECHVGCELPFPSDPGLCFSRLTEAALDPATVPWGRAEDTGAAGLSCCLMPSVGLLTGTTEPKLIENMGKAPSFISVSLS